VRLHTRRRLRYAGGRQSLRRTGSWQRSLAALNLFRPISTAQRRLYLVLGNGQALSYAIGVGREGMAWSGVNQISAKREWPDWTPPEEMLRRRPDLPRHVTGGIDNPLGARAMYLGSTLYRIHGSNEPDSIGTGTSSGCIRLTNEDVIDLYNRVKVGATVIVQ
jgi:lipoprotein-anchoring transpeptidase ErfK/SrfK